MMKGKLLVKVVTMEKSCEEAAEEERVLVWWWVASVEFKLEASALDERGAVAGGDLPVTGSMSLQPDTEQLGKIWNSYIFGPKYNWRLYFSRTISEELKEKAVLT